MTVFIIFTQGLFNLQHDFTKLLYSATGCKLKKGLSGYYISIFTQREHVNFYGLVALE